MAGFADRQSKASGRRAAAEPRAHANTRAAADLEQCTENARTDRSIPIEIGVNGSSNFRHHGIGRGETSYGGLRPPAFLHGGDQRHNEHRPNAVSPRNVTANLGIGYDPRGRSAYVDIEPLRNNLGGGHSLDKRTREYMEARFGRSFDAVRIHTGPTADAVANALAAHAFTVGNHIGFARDQYRPGTAEGDFLLAHELTHVVQTSRGAPQHADSVRKRGSVSQAGDAIEVEAVRVAEEVTSVSRSEVGNVGQSRFKQELVDHKPEAVLCREPTPQTITGFGSVSTYGTGQQSAAERVARQEATPPGRPKLKGGGLEFGIPSCGHEFKINRPFLKGRGEIKATVMLSRRGSLVTGGTPEFQLPGDGKGAVVTGKGPSIKQTFDATGLARSMTFTLLTLGFDEGKWELCESIGLVVTPKFDAFKSKVEKDGVKFTPLELGFGVTGDITKAIALVKSISTKQRDAFIKSVQVRISGQILVKMQFDDWRHVAEKRKLGKARREAKVIQKKLNRLAQKSDRLVRQETELYNKRRAIVQEHESASKTVRKIRRARDTHDQLTTDLRKINRQLKAVRETRDQLAADLREIDRQLEAVRAKKVRNRKTIRTLKRRLPAIEKRIITYTKALERLRTKALKKLLEGPIAKLLASKLLKALGRYAVRAIPYVGWAITAVETILLGIKLSDGDVKFGLGEASSNGQSTGGGSSQPDGGPADSDAAPGSDPSMEDAPPGAPDRDVEPVDESPTMDPDTPGASPVGAHAYSGSPIDRDTVPVDRSSTDPGAAPDSNQSRDGMPPGTSTADTESSSPVERDIEPVDGDSRAMGPKLLAKLAKVTGTVKILWQLITTDVGPGLPVDNSSVKRFLEITANGLSNETLQQIIRIWSADDSNLRTMPPDEMLDELAYMIKVGSYQLAKLPIDKKLQTKLARAPSHVQKLWRLISGETRSDMIATSWFIERFLEITNPATGGGLTPSSFLQLENELKDTLLDPSTVPDLNALLDRIAQVIKENSVRDLSDVHEGFMPDDTGNHGWDPVLTPPIEWVKQIITELSELQAKMSLTGRLVITGSIDMCIIYGRTRRSRAVQFLKCNPEEAQGTTETTITFGQAITPMITGKGRILPRKKYNWSGRKLKVRRVEQKDTTIRIPQGNGVVR